MIYMTLPEDKVNIIPTLIRYHKSEILKRRQMLFDYYNGKHTAILNKKRQSNNVPNNKIINPYPRYIVNTVQGYFLGKPVRYDSHDRALYEMIDDIFDNNYEDDLNLELAKSLSICGEAFEVVLLTKEANQSLAVKFAQLPALQTMAIYDDSVIPKLTAVFRYYEVRDYLTNKDITKVEIYLDDRIEYYSQTSKNSFVLDEVVPHHFGCVPVVHYLNNAEAMGDFEVALSQIDAYDRTISTNLDEIEKFSNAYLILQGLDGTDDDEMKQALKNLALKVPEGADISWLTKDLSSTTIFEQLKVLDEKIHTMTQVPNLTDDSFANNSSGVAIQYKLTAFENLISAKERKFEQGLRKRLELIVNALNLKGNNFDYKEIAITFDRNLPNDLLNISQVVANLGAYLPIETLLPIIPFIKEPQEVLDLLDKRQDIQDDTQQDIGNDIGNDIEENTGEK